MATGSDLSYKAQAPIYRKQQPAGTTVNGGTVTEEQVFDGGSLTSRLGLETVNGALQPYSIAYAIAPGAATVTNVTGVVKDANGNAIARPFLLTVLLSDAASGAGLTGTTASGTVSFTTGALLATDVAKKCFKVQTDATGTFVLSITDAAKTGFFIAAAGEVPSIQVSRQLLVGDYG